jgi:FAD:protein FMN transferase
MGHDRPDRSIAVDSGDDCLKGHFLAMASPCEVLVESTDKDDAKSLTAIVAAEAWRIEDKFSRYLSGNIIDRINNANGQTVEVDDETADLIEFAVTLHELSEGAFDVTSGVLRRVWRFDGSSRLPSRKSVKQIMRQVGWRRVDWQRPFLTMKRGMEIDLGGIGKEYAVDRCVGIVKKETAAACLVNFGGDLASTAAPLQRSGWKVGIESVPQQETARSRVLNLKVGALATSGDARRFLLGDGVRYSHILDPKTGWPVPDAPRSITVAADTCTQAGMLSTIAMLKGAQAEVFLDAQGVRYWCNRGATH